MTLEVERCDVQAKQGAFGVLLQCFSFTSRQIFGPVHFALVSEGFFHQPTVSRKMQNLKGTESFMVHFLYDISSRLVKLSCPASRCVREWASAEIHRKFNRLEPVTQSDGLRDMAMGQDLKGCGWVPPCCFHFI